MNNHWKPDNFSQPEADYDDGQVFSDDLPTYEGNVSTPRKARGKLSREGERRKAAAYRKRHGSQWRAYMRNYMRVRRAQQKAQDHAGE